MAETDALLDKDRLERYLTSFFERPVRVREIHGLGGEAGAKGFGYGKPVRLDLDGAPVARVVLHLAGSAGFGHDTLADRAVEAILPYETFNSLPHHVPAFDVGVLDGRGELMSLREVRDFFYVTGYAEGEPYFTDLARIAAAGRLEPRDLERADLLADALVAFHGRRKDAPELYRRRTRDLFGHHECIAGLLDSYDGRPLDGYTSREELIAVERAGVDWRRRLKGYTHRLCRVHGDYHPWNVLFDGDNRLSLLDRSRGEWGEAADDLSCMTINYMFFSVRTYGTLAGPFETLWRRFFERYLGATGDTEVAELLPPFYVWRALVVASPVWYPDLPVAVRRTLFRFIRRAQALERFDWQAVGALLEE